jgi:phage tail-like protein
VLPGLATAHPLEEQLPALYREEGGIAGALTAALDEVLAPVIATLDNFAAYLDPMLTPADFVEWLSGWMGMATDETTPLHERRAIAAHAAGVYRRRGTVAGIAEQIEMATGVAPEVVDSGGASWSGVPGGTLPGTSAFRLTVRLRVPDPGAIDRQQVDAIVAEMKPAHVVHEVEVLRV